MEKRKKTVRLLDDISEIEFDYSTEEERSTILKIDTNNKGLGNRKAGNISAKGREVNNQPTIAEVHRRRVIITKDEMSHPFRAEVINEELNKEKDLQNKELQQFANLVENANLHNGQYLIDEHSHYYLNSIKEQSNYSIRELNSNSSKILYNPQNNEETAHYFNAQKQSMEPVPRSMIERKLPKFVGHNESHDYDKSSLYSNSRVRSEYHSKCYGGQHIIEQVVDNPVLTSNSISGTGLWCVGKKRIRVNPDSVSRKSRATSSFKKLPPIKRNQESDTVSKLSRTDIISMQRNKYATTRDVIKNDSRNSATFISNASKYQYEEPPQETKRDNSIMSREYMITEEALKENKKLQDIITQINTENKTLKEQLQIHQTQQTNIEPKPRIDEANTQYLVGNIKELKKENKRIQDLYNGLSSNFSKLAAMVEQNNLKRDINPNLAKDIQENKQPILNEIRQVYEVPQPEESYDDEQFIQPNEKILQDNNQDNKSTESNKIENEFSPINDSKGKNNSVHSQENQEITESLNRYVSPTSNNQVSSQNANLSQIEILKENKELKARLKESEEARTKWQEIIKSKNDEIKAANNEIEALKELLKAEEEKSNWFKTQLSIKEDAIRTVTEVMQKSMVSKETEEKPNKANINLKKNSKQREIKRIDPDKHKSSVIASISKSTPFTNTNNEENEQNYDDDEELIPMKAQPYLFGAE